MMWWKGKFHKEPTGWSRRRRRSSPAHMTLFWSPLQCRYGPACDADLVPPLMPFWSRTGRCHTRRAALLYSPARYATLTPTFWVVGPMGEHYHATINKQINTQFVIVDGLKLCHSHLFLIPSFYLYSILTSCLWASVLGGRHLIYFPVFQSSSSLLNIGDCLLLLSDITNVEQGRGGGGQL